ncbi:MAG TPA: S41 family peptidase [Bryobacterales bacterium]|nr:S41 family peptidase [Bryobacterales bacterium]
MMRFLLVLALLAGPLRALDDDRLDAQLRRFLEVYSVVEANHADPIDPEAVFYEGALPGMIQTLDPHSAFLNPDQFESLREMQRSTVKGFGSVVSLLPGRVIVLQTLPGSPSARAGLSPGDEIVVINRYPLASLSIEQLMGLLGQSRRQKAQLMVKRPDFARLIPMELVPAEMADPSVRQTFFLEPGIAYTKLVNFEQATAGEFRTAIERLGLENVKGLVLDLRGNPGGIVESAAALASFFLEPGQNVLWIAAREGPAQDVKVPDDSKPYRFPVSILVDDRSASAAELLAGALQDHDRASIIGDATFGKGLVQSVFQLSEGAAIALTTARYLTPSGRSIQRPLRDCDLYALAHCDEQPAERPEFKTDSGRIVKGGGGINPDHVVEPRGYSEFEAAMEGSNSFFEFAQQYLRRHGEVDQDFEVSAAMLDEFHSYLDARRIQPSLPEWSSTVGFIRSRLQQECFNLAFGVEKGDEIAASRDPMIQAAMRVLREQSGSRSVQ